MGKPKVINLRDTGGKVPEDFSKFWEEFALELADVQIYLSHLARKAGINLDAAVEQKIKICEERWGITPKAP